jgi:hypothetical protein
MGEKEEEGGIIKFQCGLLCDLTFWGVEIEEWRET